jgi:hypothetical protein
MAAGLRDNGMDREIEYLCEIKLLGLRFRASGFLVVGSVRMRSFVHHATLSNMKRTRPLLFLLLILCAEVNLWLLNRFGYVEDSIFREAASLILVGAGLGFIYIAFVRSVFGRKTD